MEQTGFFKWVWRVNGVAVLIALLAFFWLFYDNEIRDRRHKPHHGEVIAPIVQDPKSTEELSFSGAIKIDGSNYSMLPLVSKDEIIENRPVVYYGGGGRLAKNILFINRQDNSSLWLFKDNNQLIETYTVFPNSYPYEYGAKVKFTPKVIYYQVIDSNEKKKNLAISDTLGQNYKVLVKGISRIIAVDKSDKNSILFIYQKDGIGHSLKFDMDKFETVSDVLLPKVGE
jgi:hypothetical protein